MKLNSIYNIQNASPRIEGYLSEVNEVLRHYGVRKYVTSLVVCGNFIACYFGNRKVNEWWCVNFYFYIQDHCSVYCSSRIDSGHRYKGYLKNLTLQQFRTKFGINLPEDR